MECATADARLSEGRNTSVSAADLDLDQPESSAEAGRCAERDVAARERARAIPAKPLCYRFVKRLFDIVFSACAVAVLALPIAVLCIVIRLETPGAPIYAQKRMGVGGRVIRVLKLRSMVTDAEDVERYLNADQLRQWQSERKVDQDPRITRVGSLVRRCSLDEVPQFLNVLKGDLSVIGPRPITEDELEQHFTSGEREELLSVRPGITGLWQTTERNAATFESGRRQQIELQYVRERSLALDAKCFFGTFDAMFGEKATGR